MRKLQLLLMCIFLVLTGCTQINEKVITAKETSGNKIFGNQIVINSFKFIYEDWAPGNSGYMRSKLLVFSLNDKDIAIINRQGLKGRDIYMGGNFSGTSINDGSKIKYGDGQYGFDSEIIASECSLEYGAGRYKKYGIDRTEQGEGWSCQVGSTYRGDIPLGKCLFSCKSKLIVEIIDKDRLDECLASKTNEAIPNILKEGVHIFNLDLNSTCSFYNGEFLKLIE